MPPTRPSPPPLDPFPPLPPPPRSALAPGASRSPYSSYAEAAAAGAAAGVGEDVWPGSALDGVDGPGQGVDGPNPFADLGLEGQAESSARGRRSIVEYISPFSIEPPPPSRPDTVRVAAGDTAAGFGTDDVDRLEALDEISPYIALPPELGVGTGGDASAERSTSRAGRRGRGRAAATQPSVSSAGSDMSTSAPFTLTDLLGLPSSSSSSSMVSARPSTRPTTSAPPRPTRAEVSARLASELQSRTTPSTTNPSSTPFNFAAGAGAARPPEPRGGNSSSNTWEGGIRAARERGYGSPPPAALLPGPASGAAPAPGGGVRRSTGPPIGSSRTPAVPQAAPAGASRMPVLNSAVRAGSNPVPIPSLPSSSTSSPAPAPSSVSGGPNPTRRHEIISRAISQRRSQLSFPSWHLHGTPPPNPTGINPAPPNPAPTNTAIGDPPDPDVWALSPSLDLDAELRILAAQYRPLAHTLASPSPAASAAPSTTGPSGAGGAGGAGGSLSRRREEREVDRDLRMSSSVDSAGDSDDDSVDDDEEEADLAEPDFWGSTSARADADALALAQTSASAQHTLGQSRETLALNPNPDPDTDRTRRSGGLQRRALRSEVDLLAPHEGPTVVRGLPAPSPDQNTSAESPGTELRRGTNNRRRHSLRFTGEAVDFALGVEGVRRAGPGGGGMGAASASASGAASELIRAERGLPPWRRGRRDLDPLPHLAGTPALGGAEEGGMDPTNGTGEPRDPPLVVRSSAGPSRPTATPTPTPTSASATAGTGLRRRRSSTGSLSRSGGSIPVQLDTDLDVQPRKRPRRTLHPTPAAETLRPSYLQYTTLPAWTAVPSGFEVPSFLSRLALTKYHPSSPKTQPLASEIPGPSWPLVTFTEYPPPTQNDSDAAALRTSRPIPRGLSVHYYEVKVVSSGPEGYMSVGWMQGHCSTQRLVGWDKGSWGWHADDARTFEGRGKGELFHKWGVGDTIGCGIDFTTRRAFFTRNGQFLDHRFRNITPDPPLFPAVALRNVRESLAINLLGPFEFDIDAYVRRAQERVCEDAMGLGREVREVPRLVDQPQTGPAYHSADAESASTVPAGSPLGDPGQKTAAAFVIDYLNHHGHSSALDVLKRDMSKRNWLNAPPERSPSANTNAIMRQIRDTLSNPAEAVPWDLINTVAQDPSVPMSAKPQSPAPWERNVPGRGCTRVQLQIQDFISLLRRADAARTSTSKGALDEAETLDASVLEAGRQLLDASSDWDLSDARVLSAAFGLVSLPVARWPTRALSDSGPGSGAGPNPNAWTYRVSLASRLESELRAGAGAGLRGSSLLERAVWQTGAVWGRLREKADGEVGLVDVGRALRREEGGSRVEGEAMRGEAWVLRSKAADDLT